MLAVALPPNLYVLDVGLNTQLGGTLPSPLPPSMVFLGATSTSLSGKLPELPQGSSLMRMLLGNNSFEGE